jgi:hypothetical protein
MLQSVFCAIPDCLRSYGFVSIYATPKQDKAEKIIPVNSLLVFIKLAISFLEFTYFDRTHPSG